MLFVSSMFEAKVALLLFFDISMYVQDSLDIGHCIQEILYLGKNRVGIKIGIIDSLWKEKRFYLCILYWSVPA